MCVLIREYQESDFKFAVGGLFENLRNRYHSSYIEIFKIYQTQARCEPMR
jgi:hypothetical protein